MAQRNRAYAISQKTSKDSTTEKTDQQKAGEQDLNARLNEKGGQTATVKKQSDSALEEVQVSNCGNDLATVKKDNQDGLDSKEYKLTDNVTKRDKPRRGSVDRSSTISEDGNYEWSRSSSASSITSVSSVASSKSAKRASVKMDSLPEEEPSSVDKSDEPSTCNQSQPSNSSPRMKRTKHILHRQNHEEDSSELQYTETDVLAMANIKLSNSSDDIKSSSVPPEAVTKNDSKISEDVENTSNNLNMENTFDHDNITSPQNILFQNHDKIPSEGTHNIQWEEVETFRITKPPSPTIGPIKFMEDLEICLNDDEECIARPIVAQDVFSCSSEVVLSETSSLFKEIQENTAFLEKHTNCKLLTLKIPMSEFASQSCDVKSGPFVLKGYALQAHLPIVDDSLSLAIAIQKGPDDDHLPWPFKEVVIFRIEKYDWDINDKDTEKASPKIIFMDKGFSTQSCTGELESCVSKPVSGDNAWVGLKFISKNDLKEFETLDGHILVHFLFLPKEAGDVTGIDMEIPTKVCEDRIDRESGKHDCSTPSCFGRPSTTSTRFTLPVSLEQYGRGISIIKFYCGVTLVSVNFFEIAAVLNSEGISEQLEKYFKVPMDSRSHLNYSVKLVVKITNHMVSVGLALAKGPHDDDLTWPFVRNVVFQLCNEDPNQSIEQGFLCSDNNKTITRCLQRPENDSNNAVGMRDWVSTSRLLEAGFITDNGMIIKILMTPREFILQSPGHPSIIS